MIDLIKKILEKWGCRHQWERWKDFETEARYTDKTTYHVIVHCPKCGAIRRIIR